MRQTVQFALAAMAIAAGVPAIAGTAGAASGSTKLDELVDRYIAAEREEAGSRNGPADVSAASFQREIDEERELLTALLEVPADGLSLEKDIDRRLLIGRLSASVHTAEARRLWENDASLYLPSRQIGMLLEPAASRPATERARELGALLADLPDRLEHARANLKRPAPYFTQEAIFQAGRLISTIDELGPALVEAAGADEKLEGALRSGRAALESYLAFLEDELLPRSDGSWALGEANYNYILRHRWFLDENADEILERGREAFARTEALAQEVAARIEPGKHWTEVYEHLKDDHPAADDLKSAYQQQIDAARQFLIDNDVVTLPEGEQVITVDTPPAMRRSSPFGTFDGVGPFDEGLQGRLVLTPIEDWMSPEQRKDRLRSHHHAWIPIIAVHEAYPGHHVQALKVKENPNLLRQVVHESIFSEGWGLYCEELMFQLGFLQGDDVRLSQLRNRLWRAARVILDTQLHTGQMSFEEAVDFLVEKVRFDRYAAELEVGMYLRQPTYVLGYLVGMQEIEEIRDDYFEKFGKPESLSRFYDKLLTVGALPPALVREELFAVTAKTATGD